MSENIYDTIIIGGGPAGLTSAIYTSRANLKTAVIAGDPAGGQLMWTSEVENFPGFPQSIMGPDLIENMRKQAAKFGPDFFDANVVEIKGNYADGFDIRLSGDATIKGKSIIVCSGASAKWLNIESEQKLRGKGVSACAVCDGFFFKDKITAVVGGGDAAMEDAIYLTKYCPKVYLFVRASKESLRASKIMQKRALENPKIEFIFNTEVRDVLGEQTVNGVTILNNVTNEEKKIDISGLFVAIGHEPNTSFLKGFIDMDDKGYIVVKQSTRSSKEGVFVGGDVADFRYRQAITAAGFGCMAAMDVQKFLSEHR